MSSKILYGNTMEYHAAVFLSAIWYPNSYKERPVTHYQMKKDAESMYTLCVKKKSYKRIQKDIKHIFLYECVGKVLKGYN